MIALLLACGGDPDAPAPAPGSDTASVTPPDTDPPIDTGSRPVPCALEPCVASIAAHAWYGEVPSSGAGAALAASGGFIAVGATAGDPYTDAGVHILSGTLLEMGSWISESGFNTSAGAAVDATDLEGDGIPEFVTGEPNWNPESEVQGRVVLLSGPPSSEGADLADSAQLTIRAEGRLALGGHVRFGSLTPDGATWIVGSANSDIYDGGIYVFPADLVGVHDSSVAEFRLAAERTWSFALPDLDGDGLDDLFVNDIDGAHWFLGPWSPEWAIADATGSFHPAVPDAGYPLYDRLTAPGDLNGDGAEDLAFTGTALDLPTDGAGRVYLASGGLELVSGFPEDLPDQIGGSTLGHGMGLGLAGADVSGDGQTDLVVGASGVSPGAVQGKILVYPSPVQGVLDATHAAATVYGEYPDDLLGREIEPLDADGDAQADLVVSSQFYPSGEAKGAVYLLLGAALLP